MQKLINTSYQLAVIQYYTNIRFNKLTTSSFFKAYVFKEF